ncbi:Lipoprotein signal peptidase [Candidatus Magnetomoraceae bacterium gMMP-15]
MSKNKYTLLIFVAAIVIILDQITKFIIMKTMPLYHSISVIEGFFNLTHIHNTGGAFGLMANQHHIIRAILFLGVSSVALFVILYFYKQTPQEITGLRIGLSLIFGGAVGNLIDRFRLGEVIDFFVFYIKSHHWPAFNVADSAVTIGAVIFAFYMLIKKVP